MKTFKLTSNTRVNADGVTLFQIVCTHESRERVFWLAIFAAICMLLGANLARVETEKRAIQNQTVHVRPDGVYVEYKGEFYKKE